MTGIQEPGNIEGVRLGGGWGRGEQLHEPDDRAAAVVAHVNEELSAVGVPGSPIS